MLYITICGGDKIRIIWVLHMLCLNVLRVDKFINGCTSCVLDYEREGSQMLNYERTSSYKDLIFLRF